MRPQSFPVTETFRGYRLDRFLMEMLPRMSRASIQEAIETRVSLASGAGPKSARRLVPGEIVTIRPREAVGAADMPDDAGASGVEIPVLLERAGWIAVDKPAGLSSVPTARRPGADVASILGLAPAHRLDRFTSGCLLLTREAAAARFFDAAFREGRIRKEYVAVVEGSPSEDVFEIDAPLGQDVNSRVPGRVAVRPDGAAARTRFEVIARLPGRSMVRALPLTGRKHQLRAHLAHAGFPIVGDLLYGGDERRFVRWQLGQPVEIPEGLVPGRHLLHARSLAFTDADGESLLIEAPWPADFPG